MPNTDLFSRAAIRKDHWIMSYLENHGLNVSLELKILSSKFVMLLVLTSLFRELVIVAISFDSVVFSDPEVFGGQVRSTCFFIKEGYSGF